ncbi:MAG: hypothetical protein D6732_20760 [Methanobacteriota archaeon]|nr:MAG: hypothetical protein D6732_20760 [Euryarchaeota archaeon]
MTMSTEELNYFNIVVMLVIFVITYYLIIKKSFDKNIAAALGALTALVAGEILSAFDQEEFLAVDLGHDYLILAILLGNLLMVVVASEVGLFQFISIKLLKATKGDPRYLYFSLGTLTLLLSSLVNTIPAILVVGALTIVACSELNYNPRPFILMEIVVTNTGGLTTLISAITNLIIAIPFGIAFIRFTVIAGPLAMILFVISMVFMYYAVPIEKGMDPKKRMEKINSFNEWSVIDDKVKFYKTSAVFALSMLMLLLSDTIGFSIAVISVGGGLLMMYASGKKFEQVLPKVDWTLLTFFASLFVLIKVLEIVGVLRILAEVLVFFLGSNNLIASLILLLFSTIISGVLDNVVLAVTLTPIIQDIAATTSLDAGPLVWALIIGTNLGGGLTPIGAPPCVLGLGILQRETGQKVGWGEFFKTVGMATIIRLVVAAIYLAILVFLVDPHFLSPV